MTVAAASATLVEIVHASIPPPISSASTDPLYRTTMSSGLCRRLIVDTETGDLKAKPEYYTIYNYTSGTLSAGDIVLATALEDQNGDVVLVDVV